jgi:Uma2 family endonuclease
MIEYVALKQQERIKTMSAAIVHHRFSVDDYEQMIRAGILTENDPVELIRGEIIEKMSIGDEHCACVKRLNHLLSTRVGGLAIVSVQDPIRLADSEPEPDVALLRPAPDFYASGKPRANDVLLLIEVADTSIHFDRDVTLPLYAEAGVREVWIVDLESQNVEVHRQPSAESEGKYLNVHTVSGSQQLQVVALPGITLLVSEFLN